MGRSAELYGEKTLDEDRLNRALEIPRLAEAEYRRLPPRIRALCDAFAGGLNYYLARHPSVHPMLLTRMEPWYTLAFIRYNYYQNGFAYTMPIGDPRDLQTAQAAGRFVTTSARTAG